VLALLCAAAYGPLVSIPLIEDDYPNLAWSLTYGSQAGFREMAGDAVFRLRATSFWVMDSAWWTFHLHAVGYHAVSLALHIAGTFLLYAILRALPRTRSAAFYAAGFFAIAEGHQEAVVWFSAINELLLFVFGMAALLIWVMAESRPGPNVLLRAASVCLFLLALVSKESAVILLPLFLLVTPVANWKRAARLVPYAVLAALAIASIVSARAYSFRFTDGSFSLAAPFWIIWPKNCARVLWVWGWLALPVAMRGRATRTIALLALAWIAIALLPYSFLTYSTQIPSRQTYLASAGLALLFGLGITELASRRLVAVVLAAAAVLNVGYLWTRKRAQFLERAAPTEQLIRLARETQGPIWVRCFPRNRLIAEEAVHMGADRPGSTLIWSDAEAARERPAATFCYGSGVTVNSSK